MRATLTSVTAAAAVCLLTAANIDLSTPAARFNAAKVVALVRVVETVSAPDSELGPLTKLLVLRSWKGPFSDGTTITAAREAVVGGCCMPFPPLQAGQLMVIFSLRDVQPIRPMLTLYDVEKPHVEEATRELDKLAAAAGT